MEGEAGEECGVVGVYGDSAAAKIFYSLRVLQHRTPSGQARLMAMHFRTGRPDRAIVGLANELGADLIVVGTHPTSRLQRLLGGSTADRVARNASCPVVVVRPKRDDEEDDDLGFAAAHAASAIDHRKTGGAGRSP